MSAQDDVEKVLRDLHIMLSKSEPVKGAPGKVSVDKQKMINLLTELNKGIYAIMDEYELTTESRDRAEREFQKQGERIVRNANHQAEDIYAASVMYTDEALNHVQEIMRMSSAAIQNVYEEMQRKLKDEVQTVKTNQLELKAQLQDLEDTDKYLKLIEDRNREIAREKARNEGRTTSRDRASIYANRMTEIRVNKAQLAKLGLADTDEEEEKKPEETGAASKPAEASAQEISAEEPTPMGQEEDNPKKDAAKEAEVRVNLDADYFRWKEEQEAGKKNSAKKSRVSVQTDEDGMSIIKLHTEDDEPGNPDAADGIQRVWRSLTAGWHS
jgi:hypothetical protein